MNNIEIRLSIIDPNFESAVLRVLAEENIECHGRYLAPCEIPLALRARTLLITSPEAQQRKQERVALSDFLAHLPITESMLAALPSLISEAQPKVMTPESIEVFESPMLVIGVSPRVGARTLSELIERKLGEELFALRKQNVELPFHILCAEIDETSLKNLFGAINQYDSTATKLAVIINKLPQTAKGRRKFGAVERELRALSVKLALPIYFDGDIQVTGLPSKQMIRACQPLFDWIADSK